MWFDCGKPDRIVVARFVLVGFILETCGIPHCYTWCRITLDRQVHRFCQSGFFYVNVTNLVVVYRTYVVTLGFHPPQSCTVKLVGL